MVVCITGFGSCLAVLANAKTLPIELVVMSCMFAAMSTLVWATSLVLIFNIEELLAGINVNMKLKNQLVQFHSNTSPTSRKLDSYWEKLSNVLRLLIIMLATIPTVLPVAGVLIGVDPSVFTFNQIDILIHLCNGSL
ncbi:unnamed protein product [Orchesella dallaii]|uniref:Uncharacterized protein n=1 Tax=Orchesella dallaii TaxID=48710 RepID=A0ABP1RGL4_9HEXA